MVSVSRMCFVLLVVGCVLCVPVWGQFVPSAAGFPSLSTSLASPALNRPGSNRFAPQTGFFPSQTASFDPRGSNPPFSSASFQPANQPTQLPQSAIQGGQKQHTYPDGTMGGDYPAHKAAQAAAAAGKTHTYPDGTMGGDYPAHKAAQAAQAAGKTHTYPDGTMGGDYPAHKAAQKLQQQQQPQQQQQLQQQQQVHTYPDGTTGGNYPAHKAAQEAAAAGMPHTYPDGTTGADYPSHKAAQQLQQQQQVGNAFPSSQFVPSIQSQLAAQQAARAGNQGSQTFQSSLPAGFQSRTQGAVLQQQSFSPVQFPATFQPQGTPVSPLAPPKHTYPDGTTGGDYPSHLKAQQRQGQVPSQGQFLSQGQFSSQGQLPGQVQFPGQGQLPVQGQLPGQFTAAGQHTYPDGTTGGDYPAHKAQQTLAQQQQVQSQLQGQGQLQGQQHTYPDGTTGGDYPSHLKALQQGQGQFAGQAQGQSLGQLGVQTINQIRGPSPTQFSGLVPSQGRLLPQGQLPGQGQHTYPDGTTGGDYPSHLKAQQAQAQTAGGQHTYPDGTTGGDYPNRLKEKQGQQDVVLPARSSSNLQTSLRAPQVFPPSSLQNQLFAPVRPSLASQSSAQASLSLPSSGNFVDLRPTPPLGASSFFPPAGGVGSNPQCFKYTDLSASYQLSDTISNYPMDAIMSELRSNSHIGPMVGYERLPEAKKSSSFFDNDSPFRSFGFLSDQGDQGDRSEVQPLANVKYFPANFDSDTLRQSVDPSDRVCPASTFTLRAVTIDNNRCSVVNADYQAVVYTKCKQRQCNSCEGSSGVKACVERYNWVSVVVYCPHWQRGSRVQPVRLHLPQGCACNMYQC